jgi:hypothetical protein
MRNDNWQQGFYLVGSEQVQKYVGKHNGRPVFHHLPVDWPEGAWKPKESCAVDFLTDHKGRVTHMRNAVSKEFLTGWPTAYGKSEAKAEQVREEYTGGSSSYYMVEVKNPTTAGNPPYMAECNDIIEALQMDFAEGNAFKAIWRSCAARMGKQKKGHNSQYDWEKVKFFAERKLTEKQDNKNQKLKQ